MRSFALLLSLTAFSLAPSLARADAPAPAPSQTPAPPTAVPSAAALGGREDEVTLKNGGMVRGTVTELDPDKSVTIVVEGSGAVRTFAFSEVDHLARGVHKSGSGGSAAPPSELQANLPGLARLHVVTPDPRVQLRHHLGSANDVLCLAPCDLVVDGRKGDEFSFGGSGLTTSAPFLVFDKQGDLTADVHPGRSGNQRGGILSLAIGAGSMIIGGIALGVGTGNSSIISGSGNGATSFGAVTLGTGAVAAIVGLVLLVSNRTTYELHPPTSAPSASPRPLPVPESPTTPLDTPHASSAAHPAPIAPATPPPPPVEEALPADEDPCQMAADYDRRAAAASEPAKTQLLRIAAHKHRSCELWRQRNP